MILSDEAKLLVQEEVLALTREQQIRLTELTEKATRLNGDLEKELKKHQGTLYELRAYKWGIRFLAAILGVGTVWALLTVPEYIDKKIGERVAKTDQLALSVSFANSSRWRDSLSGMVGQWDGFAAPEFRPSDDYKRFLFVNLLRVLGQIESKEPDDSWTGKEVWERLKKDPDYLKFKLSGDWEKDQEANNYLALCTLKFEGNRELTADGKKLLRQSALSLQPDAEKGRIPIQPCNDRLDRGQTRLGHRETSRGGNY